MITRVQLRATTGYQQSETVHFSVEDGQIVMQHDDSSIEYKFDLEEFRKLMKVADIVS